jgi:ammonia channel protein AmtB
MLGTIILWFGWYGFNAGSALTTTSNRRSWLLSLCAVNTTLSSGMAGLMALFSNYFILERRTGEPIFDLVVAMNGSLGGLVAITAGCGVGTYSDTFAPFLIYSNVSGPFLILFPSYVMISRTMDSGDHWSCCWPVVPRWK